MPIEAKAEQLDIVMVLITLGLKKKASKSSVLEKADMHPRTLVMNSVLEGLEEKSVVPGATVKQSSLLVVKPSVIEGTTVEEMIKQSYVLVMA